MTTGIMTGMNAKDVPCTTGRTGADRSHTDGLEQGRHSGEHHGHLDHVDHVRRPERKTRGETDDDRRRHVAGEHGEHMLNAERQRLRQGAAGIR